MHQIVSTSMAKNQYNLRKRGPTSLLSTLEGLVYTYYKVAPSWKVQMIFRTVSLFSYSIPSSYILSTSFWNSSRPFFTSFRPSSLSLHPSIFLPRVCLSSSLPLSLHISHPSQLHLCSLFFSVSLSTIYFFSLAFFHSATLFEHSSPLNVILTGRKIHYRTSTSQKKKSEQHKDPRPRQDS